MQEIEYLEPNKKNSKQLNNKILLLSFIGFSLVTIVLLILFFTLNWSWTIFTGVVLGYLFSLISFSLIYVAGWIILVSQNKYLFFLLFLIRLVIYAIPLIISALVPQIFSVYTAIIGLCIYPITTFFIQVKWPSIKRHKKDKGESELGA